VTDRPPGARCFVISITPFDAQGSIDEAGFRAHLSRMAEAGVGIYVGGGGSGEGYTLGSEEAGALQQIAVQEVAGRVPVRAMGVEPRTAAEMIDFVSRAAAAGVDAVQVYSLDVGHGHQPTVAELDHYFAEVLSSTQLPCILSTHQSVGYRVPVDVISGLAERFSNLSGVNCSQPDVAYLASLVDRLGDRLAIHVGGPMQALTALALGADGYLSSEANLAPHLCAAVTDAYESGDTARMMLAFGAVVRLSTILYGNGGIRATKAVLRALGLPGGYPRPPRLPLDDIATARVMSAVEALRAGEWEHWS
jgi:4-hydroxy-tetrahydrodipicolinate synthase